MDLVQMIFAVKQKGALNEHQHETRHRTHHTNHEGITKAA